MIVRNGPGEQQRAGVVPIILGLDHFGAGAGDELSEVNLKSLGLGRLDADEGLLDVPHDIAGGGVGGVDDFKGAAETQIEAEADRIGGMLGRKLRHIEAELIGFDVEIAQSIIH